LCSHPVFLHFGQKCCIDTILNRLCRPKASRQMNNTSSAAYERVSYILICHYVCTAEIGRSIRGDVKDIFPPRLEGEGISLPSSPLCVRRGVGSCRGSCMVPSRLHPY